MKFAYWMLLGVLMTACSSQVPTEEESSESDAGAAEAQVEDFEVEELATDAESAKETQETFTAPAEDEGALPPPPVAATPPPAPEPIVESKPVVSPPGTLDYFVGQGGVGLGLNNLSWGAPLSNLKASTGCTLKRRAANAKSIRHACVARSNDGQVVVVTAWENVKGSKVGLGKIVVDLKGSVHRGRVSGALVKNGFKSVPSKGKKNRWQFVSAKKRTKAELVWVPKADAVSLVLTPLK